MEVKPGYKQTEVGVIPEEWEVQTGEQITTLIGKGGSPRWQGFEYSNGGMLFVTSENVRDGFLDIREPKYLPFAFHEKLKRTKLQKHDILVNLVGASIGRSCQIRQDLGEANVNQAVAVFRVKDQYSSAFLACCFQAPTTIERILEMQVDAARPNISLGDLRRFPIQLPPLPEQRAIATALSEVDGLLGGLDRLIAKKRDLKQAAMQQLLTGQTRLPGFSGEWEVHTVAELEKLKLVKLSRGKVISKKDIDNTPGDFPIYSSSIHNDGMFGRYGDSMFDEELITWSVDGGGDFFHRRKHKFSVTNVCGFMRVDTSRIDYRFFAAELQLLHSRKSFDYQSKAHPSVVRKEYEVQLPPLPEQTAIASVLTEMDAELAGLKQRREKTRALKQAMMQELLTGRTRLVSPEVAHA